MNLISTHDFNFHPLCVRLMPFTKETASLHAKPANHKLHFNIGSIFSDERNPPFWCADAQFKLLRILRPSKYIKLIYVFGDRRLNQSRSTAVIPGWASCEERLSRSELYQPFRIDSDAVLHINFIHWIRFGSMWSTASEPGLRRVHNALASPVMFPC